MSSAKALAFYNSLSPQQKHFIDKKTLSTTLTVKQWLGFLTKASAYDEYGATAMKGITKRIIIFVILTAASFVPVFMFPSPFIAILPAIGFLLVIFQALDYRKFKNRDISDYLRLFFLPFLKILVKKAGEDAKLSAAVDFRNPLNEMTPNKYVDSTSLKRKIKLYEPKILLAKVTLLDGAYLETVVADEIREISYWKRSMSGKSKLKKKLKTTHNYFIKLTVPKDAYQIKDLRNSKNLEASQTDSEITIKFKGKLKKLEKSILPVSIFFNALHEVYHRLRPIGSSGESTESFDSESPSLTPGVAAAAIPAAVWAGSYFNDYDYDSTNYQTDPNLVLNDDQSGTNIFDS